MTDRPPPRADPAAAAEEWIDARVHRPLAARLVQPLIATRITPNQVTGLACLVGVAAAVTLFLAASRPGWRLLAAGLLFAAVVLDCVDGQLARARGSTSRTGDMLDGLADLVVNISVLTAITYTLALQFGPPMWALGAVATISYGVQCSLFDFAKRTYLSRAGARPLPTAEDLAQTDTAKERARREQRSGDAFLLWFYRNYFESHRSITTALPRLSLGASETSRMRAWTWLGLGTHLAVLYTAIAMSVFWPHALLAAFIVFCTVQNALMAALLW